jgi:hypothetical protein
MQPKYKKPQPKAKPKAMPPPPPPQKRVVLKERAMFDTKTAPVDSPAAPPVTQSTSGAAGATAHIDPEAQAEVQKQLNLRVAYETRVPFKPPQVPPGLSPNQLIALAQSGALPIPPQSDKPEEEKPEEEKPQSDKAKKEKPPQE